MRVEWSDLDDSFFSSHTRSQTSMSVVWELSDQIWMTVLFTSHTRGHTRIKRELTIRQGLTTQRPTWQWVDWVE